MKQEKAIFCLVCGEYPIMGENTICVHCWNKGYKLNEGVQ